MVDVRRFSLEHGYDLIPADGLTSEELASVGVQTFTRLPLGGDYGNTSVP